MPSPERFRALLVERAGEPSSARLIEAGAAQLPPGGTLVAVTHSGLNYKDALAVTGRGPVLRSVPLVPGIDLAGTVVESSDPGVAAGAAVFTTGHGLGEERWGGYAEFARLPGAWLQPLPAGRDAAWAMALGTAGLTAALAVQALEDHGVRPGTRPVAVSGAGGGVGSIAVMLLAAAGHRVAAVSGRAELGGWLQALGAGEVLPREALLADAGKPLASQRWAGGIDAVGGRALAGMLAATTAGGCVAACGLAGGSELPTTVMPFILRGVALVGIESVRCPGPARQRAWERLAAAIPPARLASLVRSEPLAAVPGLAPQLLAGTVRGRIVVEVRG
jgi:acrylyl-CoA reductase (NADPH)